LGLGSPELENSFSFVADFGLNADPFMRYAWSDQIHTADVEKNRLSTPLGAKGGRRRQVDGTAGLPSAPEMRLAPRQLGLVPKSEVVALFNHLVCADGCYARAAIGPLVRCPSRRLCAIPNDDLVSQIDEGAQARGHVATPWII
jgi:hypothetical protein